jgi:hypothetical protein
MCLPQGNRWTWILESDLSRKLVYGREGVENLITRGYAGACVGSTLLIALNTDDVP